MSTITLSAATEAIQAACQSWALWESGNVDTFEYVYDQDVQFVVQAGEATIHSASNSPVHITPGCHVIIRKGVEAKWQISQAIVNRYQYL